MIRMEPIEPIDIQNGIREVLPEMGSPRVSTSDVSVAMRPVLRRVRTITIAIAVVVASSLAGIMYVINLIERG